MAQKKDVIEEVLEQVWTKQEDGQAQRAQLLKCNDPRISPILLDSMIKDGYLKEAGGDIGLTQKGHDIAFRIIRSHRLAERLFTDILELGEEYLEPNACTFEHILSREVTTAMCTLLGHPRECPHGRPIPMGECCTKAVKEVERVVMPLAELKSGESSKIMYVATKDHVRLDMLTSMGISPGIMVRVHQTFPSFVINVSETDIALDKDVLKDIYVRKGSGKM